MFPINIHRAYPHKLWRHVFAERSVRKVSRNRGGGFTIQLEDGRTLQSAFPTDKYSTNYKAKARALWTVIFYL